MTQIKSLKHRLTRLSEVVFEKYPDCVDQIPSPDVINLEKLQNAVVITDGYNTALKLRHIYLSISQTGYSFDYATDARKQALMGKRATNDEAESTLGGATANIQRYGCINLSNAGSEWHEAK